jgi:hypothetical protein
MRRVARFSCVALPAVCVACECRGGWVVSAHRAWRLRRSRAARTTPRCRATAAAGSAPTSAPRGSSPRPEPPRIRRLPRAPPPQEPPWARKGQQQQQQQQQQREATAGIAAGAAGRCCCRRRRRRRRRRRSTWARCEPWQSSSRCPSPRRRSTREL